MSSGRRYIIVTVLLFGALVLGTLILPGTWGGTDSIATQKIQTIAPNYDSWFEPVWSPPSGEIESLLFSMQAAIGGLLIGYSIGRFGIFDKEDSAN